jgi:hypothetical protein
MLSIQQLTTPLHQIPDLSVTLAFWEIAYLIENLVLKNSSYALRPNCQKVDFS